MAKFFGVIGYSETAETSPGVWVESITERSYAGDVLKIFNRNRESEHLNDDMIIDNKLSILADPFAYQNFQSMRYVEWMGALWKIKAVEVQRPRLLLSIGGVYNGPRPIEDEDPPVGGV